MIARVFENDQGKFSINVFDQVLSSNPSPEDISLPERKALDDLAFVINTMDPPLSGDFTPEDLPLEYNLVSMLDNYYGGIDWIYDDGNLWWFVSCDPIFRVPENDFNTLEVFAPVRKYFDRIGEGWEPLPLMPSNPSTDEYAALEQDEAYHLSMTIGEKMTRAYEQLTALQKVALNNFCMNTNESTMFCFSLIFGCCTVEEFAKGIVHMANLENEISLEDQPSVIDRVAAHAENVINWTERIMGKQLS